MVSGGFKQIGVIFEKTKFRSCTNSRRTHLDGKFSACLCQKILKYTQYSCAFLASAVKKFARQSAHFSYWYSFLFFIKLGANLRFDFFRHQKAKKFGCFWGVKARFGENTGSVCLFSWGQKVALTVLASLVGCGVMAHPPTQRSGPSA